MEEETKIKAGAGPENILVTGNLWRAIWKMSWPLVVTTVSSSLAGMTDVLVAGYLGSDCQAAVGISEHIVFIFLLFIMATGTGTTAIVSRHWGSGNPKRAARFAGQSLLLSISLGLVLTLAALSFAHFALGLFSSSAHVNELGKMYLSLFSIAMIPLSIVYIANAAFNAIGRSTTTMLVVVAMTTVQIAGDFLTVKFGFPVPGLGIRGIAYSALAAATTGSIVALLLLARSPVAAALKQIFPASLKMIARVVKIGVPSAFQRLAWSMSVFVLFFILSKCHDPTEAQAAWAIGMRVEGLIFMPIMALSMAVASIVGQNLGAREVDRAYSAGWRVTWLGVGVLSTLGVILFVFADPIARIMSVDERTIAHVTSYLKINAISEPFLALAMILSGALQGAADTRAPMWITFTCNWLIRLPLAYYLALIAGMGPSGAWWSMTISVAFMGLFTAWRFKGKKWIAIRA